jgi:hypothetical protein
MSPRTSGSGGLPCAPHGRQVPFLNDDLKEEVYVHQPPGFIPSKENKVIRLCKALYGL